MFPEAGTFKGMDRDRALSFVPVRVQNLPPGTVVTAGTGELLGGSGAQDVNVTLEAMPTYLLRTL